MELLIAIPLNHQWNIPSQLRWDTEKRFKLSVSHEDEAGTGESKLPV